MKHKVLAYLSRGEADGLELLVFRHRDQPEAGWQVPAGTVEPGEPLEAALRRELREETGLVAVEILGELATQAELGPGVCRHVFHLRLTGPAAEAWEHVVSGEGEDAGLVFRLEWARVAALRESDTLAAGQGRWLDRLPGGPRAAAVDGPAPR